LRHLAAAISLLALTACGLNGTDGQKSEEAAPTARAPDDDTIYSDNLADTMASHDGKALGGDVPDIPDPEQRPIMQLQVALDRQGFGPGVIDGKMGLSTENALTGFQEARGLTVSGKLDQATQAALSEYDSLPATRVVRVPDSWSSLTFTPMPDDPAEQAKMKRLGYNSLDEKLAERFHTTIDVLRMLNPGGQPAGLGGGVSGGPAPTSTPTPETKGADQPVEPMFSPGQVIRVPNVGADRIAPDAVKDADWRKTLVSLGVGSEQPEAAKIVVSRKRGTLRAFDGDGKLVALFTVTSGSSHDPLPLGNWGINGVAYNPPFAYNPELFWDVPDSKAKQQLPPGPNGPVGVVWIDLTKEHYGIHGTPEPQTIGRTQSHGCVRLTNWDAARLAQMVSGNTKVVFEA